MSLEEAILVELTYLVGKAVRQMEHGNGRSRCWTMQRLHVPAA
jgi:hypothetical protein